jgi:hypothetical protein
MLTLILVTTFNHMQNTGVNHIWEISVADGTYDVHLAMGDPQYVSHTNNVYIEDALQQDTAGTATGIDEFDTTVEVTDGRPSGLDRMNNMELKLCSSISLEYHRSKK